MARSTCPKCSNHSFELSELSPSGSKFKMYFIQCSSCGAPAGVAEYYNTGAKIEEVEKKLGDKIQSLESSLYTINQNLALIMRTLQNISK